MQDASPQGNPGNSEGGFNAETLYRATRGVQLEAAKELLSSEKTQENLGAFLCCMLPLARKAAWRKASKYRASDLVAEWTYNDSFNRLIDLFYEDNTDPNLIVGKQLASIVRTSFYISCRRSGLSDRHNFQIDDQFVGSYAPHFDAVLDSKQDLTELLGWKLAPSLKCVLDVLAADGDKYVKDTMLDVQKSSHNKCSRVRSRPIDIIALAEALGISEEATSVRVKRLRKELRGVFKGSKQRCGV